MTRRLTEILLTLLFPCLLNATPLRQVEKLDRGLVVLKTGEGEAILSWRLLGYDPENTAFHLDRRSSGDDDWTRLTGEPLRSSFFIDRDFDPARAHAWSVIPLSGEHEGPRSRPVTLPAQAAIQPFLEIPIEKPPGGTSPDGKEFTYRANDLSVGDLDGDGDLEYLLRWEPTNSWGGGHGAHTGPVIIDAYDREKGRLWRINLGPNINASAHITQMAAYDFDGDGRCELFLMTADGTIDGTGQPLGEARADFRDKNGLVYQGVEYLTVFEGATGRALASVPFTPQRHPETATPTREQTADIWGDDYGNRMNRFALTPAYLDGSRPSLVTARGYYGGRAGKPGRTCLSAWNWRDGKLTPLWTFDTLGHPENQGYIGQGNHQVSVADVDGDGRDEIIYGACAIDDNGRGLYTTGLGHGDSLHVGDLDPARPGLETMSIHEGRGHDAGTELRAPDGSAIWKKHPGRDVGRGVAFDIDPRHPGAEVWSSGEKGIFNIRGEKISDRSPRWCNMAIWWDGDLLRELLDGSIIDKWDWENERERRLVTGYRPPYNGGKINGSKSNPCLVADILGDW
ncbi:MAG: rhamnogalacturonan lyase, partial [Verrucomicrobiales bacterium]